MSNTPRTRPERTQIRQDTIRKLSKRAIKAAGIDIPSIKLVDQIASLVTLQCEEQRARHVEMVRKCIGRDINTQVPMDTLLSRLAWIIESYWVDQNGDEEIPWEEAP